MSKKFGGKFVLIIVILAVAGLIWWRGFIGGSFVPNGSLPVTLTAELGAAQTYKSDESGGITFAYPGKLNVTETPLQGDDGKQTGKTILVESNVAKKGFQVAVLPFDENIVLTKKRILQDEPDKAVDNEKATTVGSGVPALAFDSEDPDFGATYEIWFVHNGFIYEAQTYPEFGPTMAEILNTLNFK